ncbi:hypothetical protein V757_00380 [Pelistega indica]|uniref:Uncharacterized protein n=1 Tax=Pelistega indica TaxID=1414851 RepID=V8GBG9_9BURK|nr:hypothetical protein [Pelistega indica]ETD73097.1 hypothetical protein V757_00380 [Pelistega indica]
MKYNRLIQNPGVANAAFTLLTFLGTVAAGFIFTLSTPHTMGFYFTGTATTCLLALFIALVVSHLEHLFDVMEGK